MFLFVLLFGFIIGSFIGAFSYRAPRGVSILKGRSYCPKCKKTINAYDNIPLFSYLLLGGKCRHCKHNISPRYFFIELVTGLLFGYIFLNFQSVSVNLVWITGNYILSLGILLLIASILVAIFVIDLEHQLILDTTVYFGIFVLLTYFLIYDFQGLFIHLLSGLVASLFFLSIHILTYGKGMGLGDVKLAIFAGMVLGPTLSLLWIFLSFILGGIVGTILLIFGKAHMKQKIAFGPFLVVGVLLCLFWGSGLIKSFFPLM